MKIFGRILLVLIFFSSTCFVSTSVQAAPKSFTLDSSKIYHYATYGKKKTSKTTYRYHTLYRYWKGTKQQELWDLQTTEKYYWGSDLGVLYVIQRDVKKGSPVSAYNTEVVGEVLQTSATVKTPAGTFKNCTVAKVRSETVTFAPHHGLIQIRNAQQRITYALIKVEKRK